MREIMKKILFATTALVALAGAASAEVALSGWAEIGVAKNENGSGDFMSGDLTKTQVFTDLDVTFSMSGTADNGLSFGASIDLDEARLNDQTDASRMGNATIFMSFGGATLTVGDTDSAFDARLTETAMGGAINDDHTVHPGYNGNSLFDEAYGGQEIRLDYAFDAFTVSVSTSPDRFGTFDPSYAIGFSYGMEMSGVDVNIGLGYITTDEASAAGPVTYDDAFGISFAATFSNGLSAVLGYSTLIDSSAGGLDNGSHIGIGLGYTMNALSMAVNYGEYDFDTAGSADGYGLTVNYDLGGGLVAQFGYGGGTPRVGTYEDTYSLGLAMSF
jgi:outer membrane protein OmpU